MDVNEYMVKNLALLTRIAVGVEALLEASPPIVNIYQVDKDTPLDSTTIVASLETTEAAPAKTAPAKTAPAKTAPAKTVADKASRLNTDPDTGKPTLAGQPIDKSVAELEAEAAEVEADIDAVDGSFIAAPGKTAAAAKVKRATPDEARAALMAFAKREGNYAAMELLGSLGGVSVSALADACTDDDDKLAQLIEKCKG